MPSSFCPRCAKKFQDQTSVLKHLNQPISACRSRYEDFLKQNLAQKVSDPPTTLPPSQPINFESNDPHHPMDQDLAQSAPPAPPFLAGDTVGITDHDIIMADDSTWLSTKQISASYHTVEYAGAAHVYGDGPTFMDKFDSDENATIRKTQLYYPFATRAEWELASFLLESSLSMAAIDRFLKLELIKNVGLSFRTAKDLRSRMEILPSGPAWKSKDWKTTYPTKKKTILYYRDPLECLQSIMESPLVKDHISLKPLQLFRSAEKVMRVYTEWITGDAAWRMQSQLPEGATLLGTILSSDKTNISAMTGNRVTHPLLISLANLDMDFRMKASNHAFLLLAIIPIPNFIHRNKRFRGLLEDRLFHECIDFITKPLKIAASIGVMMSDPLGFRRLCYPPLAACIVDTPESALISGVAGKTSSVTMADYKQFGDNVRHDPRTASTTLAQLQAIESTADPWDLDAYFKAAMRFRLNGVHRPFWRDWALSDPSVFLTSEPLHHWHKAFWDHDAKWCINVLGGPEIDFRFSVLQPHTGRRHFKEGISTLKQVTGRDHRDIQRYIIPIIADAVPFNFMVAVRALMDFRYLAQAPEIDDAACSKIKSALDKFHTHKAAILEAGARRGQSNTPINNWHIPKLEFLQSVVPNIQENGVSIQWSADVTEHAHITAIKDPARAGNNQNYEPQICRCLDREDKRRHFDLATAARDADVEFGPSRYYSSRDDAPNDDDDDNAPKALKFQTTAQISSTSTLLDNIDPVSSLVGTSRNSVDYFLQAESLLKHAPILSPLPHRTFSSSRTAFHLTRDPSLTRTSIDEVAQRFNLPDLRAALGDFISRSQNTGSSFISNIGGRRISPKTCPLSFTHLEVWTSFRLQTKGYHYPYPTLSPKTVNVAPPSKRWPVGHHDAVILNLDSNHEWPHSSLQGHTIAQLRIVFRIVPPHRALRPMEEDLFLAYVQRFDVVPQVNSKISGSPTIRGHYPESSTGLHVVRRALRASKEPMGDIVPLNQVRELVQLTPRFGAEADRHFEKTNSLEYASEFWLNKYFDKELFYALDV